MNLSLDELFFKGRPQWNSLREDPQGTLPEIEKRLIENPEDLGDKLCWVYGHLSQDDLPLIALTAPMQEVVPRVIKENEFCSAGLALCIKLAQELKNRKQYKLAISMLDLADDLIKQLEKESQLPAEISNQHTLELKELLELELEAAGKRREPSSYLKSIEKRIKDLPKPKKLAKVSGAPMVESFKNESSSPPKNKKVLDDDESLVIERNYTIDEQGVGEELTIGEIGSPAESLSEKLPETDAQVGAPGNSFFSYLLVFFSGVLAVAAGIYLLRPTLFSAINNEMQAKSDVGEEKSENIAKTKTSALIKLESPSVTNPDPKLLELERRVGELNKEEEVASSTEGNEISKYGAAEDSISDGPVEEVNPELKQAKLPTVPELPKNIQRETFPVDTPAQVYRKKDGRNYGSPPPSSSRVKGFPVRQFNPAQEYKVIIDTDVYTAPSLMADAVVRLRQGARVSVVSKLGNWLEIRSAEGNKGYIYSQDAQRSS